MVLKIATFNITGVQQESRRRQILRLLNDKNVDIACLQEVKFNECPILESSFKLITNLGPRKRGTAVLIRRNISIKRTLIEPEGRLLSVDLNGLTVICVYAPSGETNKPQRDEFFQSTIPAYTSLTKNPIILLGDFNAVESHGERRSTSTRTRQRLTNVIALQNMSAGLDLVDVWRSLRPNEQGFTFHSPRSFSRIDRIYSSRQLNFTDIEIARLAIGDHDPLIASLSYDCEANNRRNTSFLWKLNTAILSEERYARVVSNFIEKASKHPAREKDVGHWWEQVFKPGLKRETIQYCKTRAWLQRNTREFLQDCLSEVINATKFEPTKYYELKRKFREWEAETLKGGGIRSRLPISDGEESSIFHINKAKNRRIKSHIQELKTTCSNTAVIREEDINKEIIAHFERVFKNHPPPNTSFENGFLDGVKNKYRIVDKHSHADKQSMTSNPLRCQDTNKSNSSNDSACLDPLVKRFESAEFKAVFDKLKRNKAPGLDGIPYEFYIQFWDLLDKHFIAMMKQVLNNGSVLPSQGTAAVRLVPKTESPQFLADYRPIALLNCDYKIIASLLASRLRNTLSSTINEHQKGGVPGRYIFDNLSIFRDIIEMTNKRAEKKVKHWREHGAAILGFDFEKAYDLVNRDILWHVMKTMGYPDKFITWLKALYKIARLCPLNGESIVGTINDVQSVRQGCPLSVHLFAIYIEPLLVKLTENLKGIDLFGHKVALRAFVDDLTVFASSDDDITRSCEIIDGFCKWTNAKLNKTKSKALGLGDWSWEAQIKNQAEKRPVKSWPVSWLEPVPSLRLLGINFSSSIFETTEREWKSMVDKIKRVCDSNKNRRFSLSGKVTFIKTFALSLSVHLAHTLPCPDKLADSVRKAISMFIWSYRREKPTLGSSRRLPHQGGLGIPHPQLFYKSLFTNTLYKLFIGREGPERASLRYWLAFQLRHQIPGWHHGAPFAYDDLPFYIKITIPTIRDFLARGLITPQSALPHRITYHALLKECFEPGRTEKQRPNFNWQRSWKWVSSIKGKNRDTVFLLYHNLLPTQARLKRHGATANALCPFCKRYEETDVHLMLQCPKKWKQLKWLKDKLRLYECKSSTKVAFFGDFGSCPNNKTIGKVMESYIVTIWESRTNNEIQPVSELDNLFESLMRK